MTIDTAKERLKLAAFDGHTDGPWESIIDDSGGQWSGWPLCIDAVNEDDKTVVRTGGQWPYEWGTKTSQHEAVQNARLIAAAPDLKRDYFAALDVIDAQAAEIERLRGALDSIRRCTSEHGGAGEALRIIHAALSEREP